MSWTSVLRDGGGGEGWVEEEEATFLAILSVCCLVFTCYILYIHEYKKQYIK